MRESGTEDRATLTTGRVLLILVLSPILMLALHPMMYVILLAQPLAPYFGWRVDDNGLAFAFLYYSLCLPIVGLASGAVAATAISHHGAGGRLPVRRIAWALGGAALAAATAYILALIGFSSSMEIPYAFFGLILYAALPSAVPGAVLGLIWRRISGVGRPRRPAQDSSPSTSAME